MCVCLSLYWWLSIMVGRRSERRRSIAPIGLLTPLPTGLSRTQTIAVIKEEVAAQKPYAAWLNENLMSLDEWTESASKQGINVPQYNLAVRVYVYMCGCGVFMVWETKMRPPFLHSTAHLYVHTTINTKPNDHRQESNRHFNMFGYTTETMDLLLYPMAVGGKVRFTIHSSPFSVILWID